MYRRKARTKNAANAYCIDRHDRNGDVNEKAIGKGKVKRYADKRAGGKIKPYKKKRKSISPKINYLSIC